MTAKLRAAARAATSAVEFKEHRTEGWYAAIHTATPAAWQAGAVIHELRAVLEELEAALGE